jgi:hypothetical protein
MPAIRPYSSPDRLAKLDGRTKESRLVRETRAELLRHVGPNPSVVQRALIEQLEQIKLRLAVMDRKFIKTGAQTDLDSRTYLAWANTYGRLLERLGVKEPSPALQEATSTLADHITARRLPADAIEATE